MIKNVVIVNDYDYVQGGASLVAIEQANLLCAAGYSVFFFCGVSNRSKSSLNGSVKIIVTNEFDSMNNPNKIKGILQGVNNVNAYSKMKELLSNLDPMGTAVFIHGYTKALSASFITACKEFNVKTFLTSHDYFSICPNGGLFNYKKNRICNKEGTFACQFCNCDSRNYLYKLYRNCRFNKQNKKFKFRDNIDYLITISKTNEALLKKFFPKSKIIRIYNPTSIDTQEDRTKCESNDFFVYVGRIDKEKGINYLCEAFEKTHEKLVLVGSGTESEKLKERFESKSISFTGWLSHDKTIQYMRMAKCLIFPCLLHEGAPLTIFEAQSQGLPCIVSKYSNASDFVDDKNGWVYDPLLHGELANLVGSITKETVKEKSISSYNAFWGDPFTKERYVHSIVKILDTL